MIMGMARSVSNLGGWFDKSAPNPLTGKNHVDLSSGRTGATSLACRRLVATVAEERLNVYGALARSLRLLCLFRANNKNAGRLNRWPTTEPP
jgi:hypothetical protein